jgi:RNA polymerase sigma factor (sigma-70 family)
MGTERHLADSMILAVLRSDNAPDEVIRRMYRSQFGIVASYIKQNNGTAEDAEDIFQEALLSFIEMIRKDKFRGESSIGTFFYAIARNTWLNELKKRGRSKLRDEKFEKAKDTTEMDVSHYMVHRELKANLMRTIDSLGETCKKILLAFYYENLAIKDILQNLQYENEQVVRNKKYKCLKQLEQMIATDTQLAENLQSILYE